MGDKNMGFVKKGMIADVAGVRSIARISKVFGVDDPEVEHLPLDQCPE